MNQIPSKIYYDINTGNVLTVTSEMQGSVIESTKEQDMEIYEHLKGKNIDEIDYIELEYGTFATTFNNVKSYSINLETKTLDFIYYTQEELNFKTSEQEEKQAISDRINTISDYANLDNNSITDLESAIITYETNLIMNGVV